MRNREVWTPAGTLLRSSPFGYGPAGGSASGCPLEFRVFQPTYNGNSSRMGGFTVIVLLTAIALVLIFVWAAR